MLVAERMCSLATTTTGTAFTAPRGLEAARVSVLVSIVVTFKIKRDMVAPLGAWEESSGFMSEENEVGTQSGQDSTGGSLRNDLCRSRRIVRDLAAKRGGRG